jgi:hypothetical protein
VVVTTVWTGNLAANMLLRPEAVARDASVDFRSGPGRLCLESAFVERGLDQQTQKLTRRYSLNSLSECLKIVDTCRQEAIAHFYPNSPYAVRLDEEGSRETGLFSLSLTSSTSSIALPAGPYAGLRARSATSTRTAVGPSRRLQGVSRRRAAGGKGKRKKISGKLNQPATRLRLHPLHTNSANQGARIT